MADRNARALADCRAVAAARVAVAQAAHTRAARYEAKLLADRDTATALLEDAGEAWRAHVTNLIDPPVAALFGRAILIRADALHDAQAQAHAATSHRDAAACAWREQDARRSRIEAMQTLLNRRAARAADERALATAADRITFAWNRR
ncbi:MAG TPA: hypothetical protein VFQ57_00920 [Sphingomonas sp.]|nr:hypothetical protein [Sphingomonas sp.]